MIELLTIIATFILSTLSTGIERTTHTLERAQQYFQRSSSAQTVSPDQEFKNNLMQGNYQRCIELIQKSKTIPTKEHFDMATKLASIEQNPVAQKNASACARFMYHDLVDRGVIKPEKNNTRGIEQILAELQRDAMGVQGQFLQAIQANDVQHIRLFLTQGAQPDLSSNYMKPAEHAIARGHKEALEVLYTAGVQPTTQHLEQAETQRYLWLSNEREPSDIKFTATTQAEGYANALRRYQAVCDFITSKLPPQPAMPQ